MFKELCTGLSFKMIERYNPIYDLEDSPFADNHIPEIHYDKYDLMQWVGQLRSIKIYEINSNNEEVINVKKTNVERKRFLKESRLLDKIYRAKENKIVLPFEGTLTKIDNLIDIV